VTRIAIIDSIAAITYTGFSLDQKVLGGSEQAVVLMAEALQKSGFDVTVFCDCDHALALNYHDVKYVPLEYLKNNKDIFDVVISSRSVVPFAPEGHELYDSRFRFLKDEAKLKIVWMHDTFCVGDSFLEKMVVDGHIDEIFTLSDFHTSYILNCDHGNRRNFEVLKNKVFQTRNGIRKFGVWTDVKAKDPDMFVFHAAASKGLQPLLERVWPGIREKIPTAKLIVIGGYYDLKNGVDEQQKLWSELQQKNDGRNGVEFTGLISSETVSYWLKKASFNLYPSKFPETFGISALESLYYNTPLITCRFGALEEVAISQACYLIDYAIEPNVLFTNIDWAEQAQKMIEMAVEAHSNKYLHQQKMYACNIVRDYIEWEHVALQWKQHIYKNLGLHFDVYQYRRVCDINDWVRSTFGRRFMNPEENRPRKNPEQRIVVITPFYKAEKYLRKCMESVLAQDYTNWKMVLCDDDPTSSDGYLFAYNLIHCLHPDLAGHFEVEDNPVRLGAVHNQHDLVREYCSEDDIVILLDGDDRLADDPHIFDYYNNLYTNRPHLQMTYGSCWSEADSIPLIAQEYPPFVKEGKLYTTYLFNWKVPYTHLRTFRARVMQTVPENNLKDPEGNWVMAGGDTVLFYQLLNNCDPNEVYAVPKITCMYNDLNPINDYKVNAVEQEKTSELAFSYPGDMTTAGPSVFAITESTTVFNPNVPMTYTVSDPNVTINDMRLKKSVLIAVPTNKYIEPETFKSIFDLYVPQTHSTVFQHFYGYRVDQVRNLIADFAIKNGFDYLFSVDSDIILPPDALDLMLKADKDVISGAYVQRIDGEKNLELYWSDRRVYLSEIDRVNGSPFMIHSCGFGCALVKTSVLKQVGYPQFTYHPALTIEDTVSEDTDFCNKARNKGYHIWAHPKVVADHKGSTLFIL
jgi:glycosyltransferase involved in cell wall biosynthesis